MKNKYLKPGKLYRNNFSFVSTDSMQSWHRFVYETERNLEKATILMFVEFIIVSAEYGEIDDLLVFSFLSLEGKKVYIPFGEPKATKNLKGHFSEVNYERQQ